MSDEINNGDKTPDKPVAPQFPADRIELNDGPSIPKFPTDRIERGQNSSDISKKGS